MKYPIKAIHSKRDHERALEMIEEFWDAQKGTPEFDALEVLVILVDAYEDRVFPIGDADPVEAIKFRLEQLGKTPKDLGKILGSRSRASEILHRKRAPSVAQIRKLHDVLGIPYESLIPST